MSLEDLLAQVRQRREAMRLEQEYVAEQKRAIEAERVRNLLVAFESAVQKYFGDVLDALDADKSFQYLNRDLVCSFAIKHAIVSITMSEYDVLRVNTHDPSIGISANTTECYFSRLKTLQPAVGGTWFNNPQKALDTLLNLIFDICEEYDHLLPEFETDRKFAAYCQTIEGVGDKSNQEIAALNTVLKAWQWPEEGRRQLKLHKITWQKHGFLDAQGESHFDYEFGWSLSDLPRSFEGYFTLLPERGKPAREVKSGYPVTVERYYFTEDELPEELLEKMTQQLDVVEVYNRIREEHSILLPQFLPELPPELANHFEIAPAIVTFSLDVPPKPCFEIRQALSLDIPDTEANYDPF